MVTRAARWKIARLRAKKRIWFQSPPFQSRPMLQNELDVVMRRLYSGDTAHDPRKMNELDWMLHGGKAR